MVHMRQISPMLLMQALNIDFSLFYTWTHNRNGSRNDLADTDLDLIFQPEQHTAVTSKKSGPINSDSAGHIIMRTERGISTGFASMPNPGHTFDSSKSANTTHVSQTSNHSIA